MQPVLSIDRPDLTTLGDEPLVERARDGDERAIRVLVRRHNRRIFRVARSIVRDDTEAEDVVQETYVRAFTRLGSFRGDAQFTTWLTRIALNEALRRAGRRRPVADLDVLDAESSRNGGSLIMFPSLSPASPETEAARGQVRRLLEETVDGLPDLFRVVFVLRDVEGLSTEETATQLSIKPETVKTRLHRARKLMRAAIETKVSAAFGELYPFDGERCVHMADRVVARLKQQGA
jgi:RNA polymerase sigma-70 factor (ECF subfamily)